MTELQLRVDVNAPAETAFAAMTDWERQSEWMLGTRVCVTRGDGKSVGSEPAAFTGIGPIGFTDTMRIIAWEPPSRCEVVHTGKLVRGTGEFVVRPRGESTSELIWIERLDLPFGAAGQLGWTLVRPAFRLGLRYSLNRFAQFAEGYRR